MKNAVKKTEITYKANSDFQMREVAGEYLLVPTGGATENFGGSILMLNETGSFIWNNLQEFCTLNSLIEKAKQEFGCPDNQLGQQIYEFISSLIKLGLIKERKQEQ